MKQVIKNKSLIAVILTIVVVSVMIGTDKQPLYAKETLPGVETIINHNGSNNPFVILEVVPDMSKASLGYLVGGEEPISGGKSLRDYPLSTQRLSMMATFDTSLTVNPSLFGTDPLLNPLELMVDPYQEPGNGSSTFDLKGYFKEKVNGEYVSLNHEAVYTKTLDNSDNSITYYEQYHEFVSLEDENSRYRITFSPVTVNRTFQTDVTDANFTTGDDYQTLYKYLLNVLWSGEGLPEMTDNTVLDENLNRLVFEEDFTGDYKYLGIIEQGQQIAGDPLTNTSYISTYNGNYYSFQNNLAGVSVTTDDHGVITLQDLPEVMVDGLRIINPEKNDTAGDYAIKRVEPITIATVKGFKPLTMYLENSSGFYILSQEAYSEYVLYDAVYGSITRYDWISDYRYTAFQTVLAQGGFVNREWVKRYVFDLETEECKSFVLDVRTITMEELNDYDLNDISMIYFAGGVYPEDITKEKIVAIKQAMEDKSLPVIFNRSTYLQAIGINPNLERLGILFQQQDHSLKTSAEILSKFDDTSFWSSLNASRRVADITYGLNYVDHTLYFYDDTDFNLSDGIGALPFVHTDFIQAMSSGMVTNGFQMVKDEIVSENFFLSVAGKTERISTDVSKAAAIRYVLNYGNKRNLIKSKIHVLQIEPCNLKKTSDENSDLETYYSLDDLKTVRTGVNTTATVDIVEGYHLLTREEIAEKWAKQFDESNTINNIRVTRMHSAEFVGKIEDLNETYDLIYLGLNTATMNTQITGSSPNRKKTTTTVFNDPSMNGLVYFHVGDVIKSGSDYFRGLLNPVDFTKESTFSEYQQYRMSGNDITLDKYNDMIEYMNAGYPIIFADDFYIENQGTYTVNTAKIDQSSYMYQIAKYALDHTISGRRMLGENVFTEGMLAADTTGSGALSKLAQYLNLSKLSITSTYLPESYNTGTTTQYLSKTGDNYILRYDVALKNDAAISLSDTKYDCKLYIDKSVDGRFQSDEEIGNLEIYELKNNQYQQVFQNTSGNYELTAGKFYKIIRKVPEGYVGVLPWKLQFTQNDNSLVRKSLTGYTAVPIPTSTKKTIRILNITHSTSRDTRFDLKSAKMQELLAQVKDFDIVIDVMSAQEYMTKVSDASLRSDFLGGKQQFSDFLSDYQMLIIGFWDSYRIESGTNLQNEAGVWAIRQYISEGRSVLFTHDAVTYNFYTTGKAYWFNLFIRDSVGMDRYGVMTKYNINQFDILPTENQSAATINYTFLPTKYDTPWLPQKRISNEELNAQILSNPNNEYLYTYRNRQAYSDFVILRNGYFLMNGSNNQNLTFSSLPFASYSNYDGHKIFVTKLNEGQITEYPFQIPETFEVSNTHGQWLQLNLDTDKRDQYTNDDIVVWYAISNAKSSNNTDVMDYYQSSINNARNNYYIYNRGNVTYSGVGHSAVNNETEMKLFINTMVAAYNAGISPPTVLYKDGTHNQAAVIDKIYLPFDSASGSQTFVDATAEIFFDVIDTNIKYGTKEIKATYFIEVSATMPYDVVKTMNGKTIYLKSIEPEIKKVSNNSLVPNIHTLEDGNRYSFVLNHQDLSLDAKNSTFVWIFTEVTYRRMGENNVEIVESSVPGFSKIEIVNLELFELR